MLPTDPKARKDLPLCTGVLDYFPDALAAVAAVSKAGNDQHNPGQELHWSRGKSTDQADCIMRHLADRGTFDKDGQRHSAKVAWRALALLQEEIERDEGLPMSRGSRAGGVSCYMLGAGGLVESATANRIRQEADGDTHMPPMQEMHDETGVPWGAASPKQPMRLAPPNMCGDCGADLGETGHFASCLSQAAHTRR